MPASHCSVTMLVQFDCTGLPPWSTEPFQLPLPTALAAAPTDALVLFMPQTSNSAVPFLFLVRSSVFDFVLTTSGSAVELTV